MLFYRYRVSYSRNVVKLGLHIGFIIISSRLRIVIIYFDYFLSLSFNMRKLVIWHFLVAIVIANVKYNFLKYTSLS